MAWKLAFVLSGKASHSLLESYNAERQPIDEFTVLQAYSRFQNRVVRKQPPAPEVQDIAVELGYRYPSGAFRLPKDYQHPIELYDLPDSPSALAGSRFPHVWLVDASDANKKISSIDLIRQNLVLVAVSTSSPWLHAASHFRIPIETYTLNEASAPYRDLKGRLRERAKLGDADALLVRPDGFIAWRAEKTEGGYVESLRSALQSILGLSFE